MVVDPWKKRFLSFKSALLIAICMVCAFGGSPSPTGNILDRVAHKNYFSLDQMVDKADCILVVVKSVPFAKVKETWCDKAHRYPPHVTSVCNFKVVRCLKQGDMHPDSAIHVQEAYKDLSFTVHTLYYVKKMTMEPYVGYYRPSITMDKADTMIVFVNYCNLKKGIKSNDTFAFTLRNSFETVGKQGEIEQTLQRMNTPLKKKQFNF